MSLPLPLFDQLKRRRVALGLSQAGVASRAGIEQSQVSKLERGLDVRLSTLMKLLTALDLDLDIVPRARPGTLEIQPTPRALRVASSMAGSAPFDSSSESVYLTRRTSATLAPKTGTLLDRYGIADGDEPKDHPAPSAPRKKR
jgi:HTH-type transcriptional regulator / antitoxin HipB